MARENLIAISSNHTAIIKLYMMVNSPSFAASVPSFIGESLFDCQAKTESSTEKLLDLYFLSQFSF